MANRLVFSDNIKKGFLIKNKGSTGLRQEWFTKLEYQDCDLHSKQVYEKLLYPQHDLKYMHKKKNVLFESVLLDETCEF